jgi:hypothetical protein
MYLYIVWINDISVRDNSAAYTIDACIHALFFKKKNNPSCCKLYYNCVQLHV